MAEKVKARQQNQAGDKVLSHEASKSPRQPVPYPDRPWEKLGLDIVRPLPCALSGTRFAVTLTDYHSKWEEVGLMATVRTANITRILAAVWSCNTYLPRRDRDPQRDAVHQP